MSQNNHNRIPSIDFIRGLSILSVIFLHINLVMPLASSSLGALLPPVLSKILLWSGYYGVITFFVVSGFLITTSAISRWGNLNQVKADQFYLIRFARIMPCLFALLIILTFLDGLGVKGFIINPDNTTLPRAIFAALTFHINWLEAQTGYLPAAWDVLWSLSIEEMFYLFFPFICRFTKGSWSFILLMLAFILVGPFARTVFTGNEIWMDHSYLSCMDGIAMGCLAALFASKYR
jgi:peptidoglycan/LPS O-acetylase OafA/YrhL